MIPCNWSALLIPALAISVSCSLKCIQKKKCTSEIFDFIWVLFGQVVVVAVQPGAGHPAPRSAASGATAWRAGRSIPQTALILKYIASSRNNDSLFSTRSLQSIILAAPFESPLLLRLQWPAFTVVVVMTVLVVMVLHTWRRTIKSASKSP